MAATILLSSVIAVYAGWVIYKKYKAWKKGQYCSCGCSGCANKNSCGGRAG